MLVESAFRRGDLWSPVLSEYVLAKYNGSYESGATPKIVLFLLFVGATCGRPF
ncbi:MAG: hypothetical protein R3Y53_04305 [Bacillota bacterium]